MNTLGGGFLPEVGEILETPEGVLVDISGVIDPDYLVVVDQKIFALYPTVQAVSLLVDTDGTWRMYWFKA